MQNKKQCAFKMQQHALNHELAHYYNSFAQQTTPDRQQTIENTERLTFPSSPIKWEICVKIRSVCLDQQQNTDRFAANFVKTSQQILK